MREQEAREDVVKGLLAQGPADIPELHPNIAGIYRKKVERLIEALHSPEDQAEAAEAIRALIEKIMLYPDPNRGEIDAQLYGVLGTIPNWIQHQDVGRLGKQNSGTPVRGMSESLVAGIGFEPMTFRL